MSFFSEYFCTIIPFIAVFSLNGEYVASFFVPGYVFLPVTTDGLNFRHHQLIM